MKFVIEFTNNIEQRLLTYIVDECSFNSEPVVLLVNFTVVVNQLNLTVVDNNKIVQVWGFCPYNTWLKSDYNVPKSKKGILKVANDLKPGFSYGIDNKKEWPVYVNIKTGWICLGNPQKNGDAVEFINNCVAIIDNNAELVSLWLKPESLPPL